MLKAESDSECTSCRLSDASPLFADTHTGEEARESGMTSLSRVGGESRRREDDDLLHS